MQGTERVVAAVAVAVMLALICAGCWIALYTPALLY